MAIKIKDIAFPRLDFTSGEIQHLGNHSASINFEAGEHRYHIWLRPGAEGSWTLGDTLYRNDLQPKRDRKTTHADPRAKANRPVIDFVLDAIGIGTVDALDSAKINAALEAHNEAARTAAAEAAANVAANRAAIIRDNLTTFATGDRITTPDVIAALTIIVGSATDDELNAIDHFFNVVI